jgi:hypothetical protein
MSISFYSLVNSFSESSLFNLSSLCSFKTDNEYILPSFSDLFQFSSCIVDTSDLRNSSSVIPSLCFSPCIYLFSPSYSLFIASYFDSSGHEFLSDICRNYHNLYIGLYLIKIYLNQKQNFIHSKIKSITDISTIVPLNIPTLLLIKQPKLFLKKEDLLPFLINYPLMHYTIPDKYLIFLPPPPPESFLFPSILISDANSNLDIQKAPSQSFVFDMCLYPVGFDILTENIEATCSYSPSNETIEKTDNIFDKIWKKNGLPPPQVEWIPISLKCSIIPSIQISIPRITNIHHSFLYPFVISENGSNLLPLEKSLNFEDYVLITVKDSFTPILNYHKLISDKGSDYRFFINVFEKIIGGCGGYFFFLKKSFFFLFC